MPSGFSTGKPADAACRGSLGASARAARFALVRMKLSCGRGLMVPTGDTGLGAAGYTIRKLL